MSIKEARDNAKSRLNTTTTEIDHKAMFTEEQLEQIGYFVADSIKTILDKIEKIQKLKILELLNILAIEYGATQNLIAMLPFVMKKLSTLAMKMN